MFWLENIWREDIFAGRHFGGKIFWRGKCFGWETFWWRKVLAGKYFSEFLVKVRF